MKSYTIRNVSYLYYFTGLTSPSYDDLFDYEQRSVSAVNGGTDANGVIGGDMVISGSGSGGLYHHYDQTNLNSPPTTSTNGYHTQFVFGTNGIDEDRGINNYHHHHHPSAINQNGILMFDNSDRPLAWRYRSGRVELPT